MAVPPCLITLRALAKRGAARAARPDYVWQVPPDPPYFLTFTGTRNTKVPDDFIFIKDCVVEGLLPVYPTQTPSLVSRLSPRPEQHSKVNR